MSETETGEAYKEDTENFYYILIYTNKKLIHIYVINNQEQIEDPSRQRTIIEEEYYEEAPSSSPPFPFLISPSPSNFFSPCFLCFLDVFRPCTATLATSVHHLRCCATHLLHMLHHVPILVYHLIHSGCCFIMVVFLVLLVLNKSSFLLKYVLVSDLREK
jgi:hypothetical protein